MAYNLKPSLVSLTDAFYTCVEDIVLIPICRPPKKKGGSRPGFEAAEQSFTYFRNVFYEQTPPSFLL
jgi:hypothetical protein